MKSLLEIVTIKFDLKIKPPLVAKVTLNFNNEYEVRFCRITIRPDNSLWFQPPALREFNYAKCFAALELSDWKKLEEKVLIQFIEECKNWIDEGVMSENFFEKINSSTHPFKLTDKDLDEIDKVIT